MQIYSNRDHTNPFLYAGLVSLAVAVIVGLLAENPQASSSTVAFLERGAGLLIGAGLSGLFLGPVWRMLKKRS